MPVDCLESLDSLIIISAVKLLCQCSSIMLTLQSTEIYDAKKGSFVDLGILDVLQIFGRAGRPQFDRFGSAFIITKHEKLSHYLTLMTRQSPIESQFQQSLSDSLNAEVSSVREF